MDKINRSSSRKTSRYETEKIEDILAGTTNRMLFDRPFCQLKPNGHSHINRRKVKASTAPPKRKISDSKRVESTRKGRSNSIESNDFRYTLLRLFGCVESNK